MGQILIIALDHLGSIARVHGNPIVEDVPNTAVNRPAVGEGLLEADDLVSAFLGAEERRHRDREQPFAVPGQMDIECGRDGHTVMLIEKARPGS